ncbi:hypothetical protein D1R32_gp284 [Tunisvirus fontaine2]|uniref:F-box containing protein n=1 Tax=Tunisvirus fontaine2 TaxID=1421067 RepID=V9SFA2_9VIRU|nr:hypothetical protein D1R32_gp284 [Tunisvirus fontaine2]AHC55001.1 hypothetical protein TNS_ORF283 [Tunisvirus fontaine2]
MELIPNEIVLCVLGFVDNVKDIALFGATCKHFHELVVSEHKNLARKTRGNPRYLKSNKHCLFHVTPIGMLHGRAVICRDGVSSMFAGTFAEGKLFGFHMTCVGGEKQTITTGRNENGKRVGVLETHDDSGTVAMFLHDEDGEVLSQMTERRASLVVRIKPGYNAVYTQRKRIYRGGPGFFCVNTGQYTEEYWTRTLMYYGLRKPCSGEHHLCCDVHRKGMPELLF